MFRPELVDENDQDLSEARTKTRQALLKGAEAHAQATGRPFFPARGAKDLPPYALLAWSAAHGMANLALSGAFTAMGMGSGAEELTRLARAGLQHLKAT